MSAKRYDQLTDQQLIRLAALANDQNPTPTMRVDKSSQFERVVRVDREIIMVFHCVDGTISRQRRGQYQKIYNIFQIIAQCVNWGVYY